MTFGVDSVTGFEIKLLEDILGEVVANELATISAGLDTSPDQPLGQVNGIFGQQTAISWELLSTAYGQFDRGSAEGVFLDNIGALTGCLRRQASKGLVTLTCNLNALTVLIGGVSAANVNGQPANKWIIKDTFTAPANGPYQLVFEAATAGPITANGGTIAVINTPVSGWNSVVNLPDAVPGTNVETDTAYRLRQVDELSAPGSATYPAMRADLLQIPGVLQVFIYENVFSTPNTDNVPGHAFEAVIYDGAVPAADNNKIASTIFLNKPTGIYSAGSTSVNVLDSQGKLQAVHFTRATQRPIFFAYTVAVDPALYPFDGDTQVKNAVAAMGRNLTMGKDVIAVAFQSTPLAIPGVKDVTIYELGFSLLGLGGVNLPITSRQIATFDTTNISVTSVPFVDVP